MSSSASNEVTLEMAERTTKPPAIISIKWQKGIQQCLDDRFSVTQAWKWWHRENLASQLDLHFADHVAPGWSLEWWKRGRSGTCRGAQALLLGPGNVDCTGWLRVGTRILWLLVLHTNSLNSLAEALSFYLHLGSPLSDCPLQQP